MSLVTIGGAPVLSGVITMPRVGAWTADLSADADAALSGPATIVAGTQRWVGTVYRGGLASGTAVAKVIGGAGGLARAVAPKFYRNVTRRILATDILTEIGEALSPRSDALDGMVAVWSRCGGKAGAALRQLCDSFGASWRVLDDGTVWIGAETWPEAQLEHELVCEAPNGGWVEISSDELALRPGTTFLGRRVGRVEHRVSGRSVRSTVWFDDDRAAEDPSAAIEAIVRHVTAGSVYLGIFPARVVSQNADGTLELQPDDSRIPGMSQVPIRYGVPGISAKVAAGARVAIEFAGGDPTQPIATVWEPGSLTEITLAASTKVVLACSEICLGEASPSGAAAVAAKVKSEIDALVSKFNAHTHSVPGVTAGPAAATSLVPTGLASLSSDTASAAVKVKP